jgi:cystathionine beta-lyase
MTLRGLRTLSVRLEHQMRSGLTVASWLAARPEVDSVLYPPLPSDPGHALWKRDMKGGSGLFSFIPKGWSEDQAKRFIDGLELFGIGASWGGFESLVTLGHPPPQRLNNWHDRGPIIRLHVGLENPEDLIADIEQSLIAASRG